MKIKEVLSDMSEDDDEDIMVENDTQKTKVSKPKEEKYRYRVMNTAGETLGYVRASNEGEAARLAAHKFSAMGIKVRMV